MERVGRRKGLGGGGLSNPPPPIISGRQECPGLAERGLNTSSPHPHRAYPETFRFSLPATQQPPTRLAEGTETDLTHTSSGATETRLNHDVQTADCSGEGSDSRAGCRDSTRAVNLCPRPSEPQLGLRNPVLPVVTSGSGFRDSRPRSSKSAGRVRGKQREGLPGCRERCAPNQQPGRPNCHPRRHSWLILFPPLSASRPQILVLQQQ